MLIWCDRDIGQGPLHTNFRLDQDGEEIGLLDSDANGNVPLDIVVFGLQRQDISYGRHPDGSETWSYFDLPTPGTSNE